METNKSKWDEPVFFIGNMRINGNFRETVEESTYGSFLREYHSDETTSPNGVAPRYFIFECDNTEYEIYDGDELVDTLYDEDAADDMLIELQETDLTKNYGLKTVNKTTWQLRTWGICGNGPSKLVSEHESEEDAENELFEHWEWRMNEGKDSANAPSCYSSEEEAIEAMAEQCDMSIDAMTSYLLHQAQVKHEYDKREREMYAREDAERARLEPLIKEEAAKLHEAFKELTTIDLEVLSCKERKEVFWTGSLSNIEKNAKITTAMKMLLNKAGIEKSIEFWKVYKELQNLIHAK